MKQTAKKPAPEKRNPARDEPTDELAAEVLAEQGAETLTSSPVAEPDSQEQDWQAQANEYLDDLRRLQAEFENYKKRQAAAQQEMAGYLIERLVLDIVPVLDNFRAATEHVPAEQKGSPWVVGIQYIEKQLESVLMENGLTVIEVNPGETFDPTRHEAIDMEQNPESGSTNQGKEVIGRVHQKGYQLGERVIRPAKVTVKNHDS